MQCDRKTAQKMRFSIKDLVTFTEGILNGKIHFLCSEKRILLLVISFGEKSQKVVKRLIL